MSPRRGSAGQRHREKGLVQILSLGELDAMFGHGRFRADQWFVV